MEKGSEQHGMDCTAAYEAHYQADSRDPSQAERLEIWTAAWKACHAAAEPVEYQRCDTLQPHCEGWTNWNQTDKAEFERLTKLQAGNPEFFAGRFKLRVLYAAPVPAAPGIDPPITGWLHEIQWVDGWGSPTYSHGPAKPKPYLDVVSHPAITGRIFVSERFTPLTATSGKSGIPVSSGAQPGATAEDAEQSLIGIKVKADNLAEALRPLLQWADPNCGSPEAIAAKESQYAAAVAALAMYEAGSTEFVAIAAAVPVDLVERCKEILAWQRTGVLPGDSLRAYAAARWPGDQASLQIAESETAREAFRVLAGVQNG